MCRVCDLCKVLCSDVLAVVNAINELYEMFLVMLLC